jgi:hypothetical protein
MKRAISEVYQELKREQKKHQCRKNKSNGGKQDVK